MPNFRYKAITQAGEIVTGSIAAPTAAEVARRIEYLGLVPVDTVTEERADDSGACLLERRLDAPAPSRHLHQCRQRRLRRTTDAVIRALRWITDPTTREQPVGHPRRCIVGQGEARPVVPARPLAALACR